jgi:hypothetical protein
VNLGLSEADKGERAGYRKAKDRREDRGPWYGGQNGMQRDLKQFSDF